MASRSGGLVREIGTQISNARGAITSIVTVAGLGSCAVCWFAANTVTRIFGPEDVIPLVGGTAVCLVCVTPVAVGGLAYAGRSWIVSKAQKVREAVYPIPQTAVPPPPPPPEIPDPEISEGQKPAITDPVAMLADSLHLLVIGHSGSGKTSLVHAVAQEWVRDNQIVIACDPDAVPGLWSGCDIRGAGDRWDQIEDFFQKLTVEVLCRREKRSTVLGSSFRPIYVVLSEYADIVTNCPSAKPLVENLLRRGRKLDIHLAIDVQDSLVATLGFEGKGKLRSHFTYIVEVSHDSFDNKRYMTITEHDNPLTARPRVLIPRLPDLDKLSRTGKEEKNHGLESDMELIIPPVPGDTSGGYQTTLPPMTNYPRINTRQNGHGPGIIPAVTGTQPQASPDESPLDPPLQEQVSELLKDERESKYPGMTVGQIKAIMLCLLATNNRMNQTQIAVFGGKSGARYSSVKTVQELIEEFHV